MPYPDGSMGWKVCHGMERDQLASLESALQQEWNAISQNTIRRIMGSMRRRVAAHGGHSAVDFHCDSTCLSCVDKLKLINDRATFFVYYHYQAYIYCC